PIRRTALLSLLPPALRPPRPLPSSPTRRSSDLGARRCPARAGRAPTHGIVRAARLARRPARVGGVAAVHLRAGPHWRTAATPPTDRKSTRLNSSHGSISYAVFCSKKKTDSQHV